MRAEIIDIPGGVALLLPSELHLSAGPVEIVAVNGNFFVHPESMRTTAADATPGSAVGIYDALVGMPDDFFAEPRYDPPADDIPSWDDERYNR